MNLRCPNCGAVHSLDSLLGNDDAAQLLKLVLELDAAIGKAAVRYLGLFRPAKSQLSFARAARLLEELLPDIRAGEIKRGGAAYPAPEAAWIHAFNACTAARDAGRLKTPLKSHGYLYEIIAAWQPEAAGAVSDGRAAPVAESKLRQSINALTQWAGADGLRRETAAGFALLAAGNLKGRPAAQDMAAVAEIWARQLASRETWNGQTDPARYQAAFKQLAAQAAEWPNVRDLIQILPPRLIPRALLAEPAPDKEKGRQEMAKIKQIFNQPKPEKEKQNGNS